MKHVTVLGMGPGDLGLLTVAGAEAIKNADLHIGADRLLEDLSLKDLSTSFCITRADKIVEVLESQLNWERACVIMSGDIGIFSGARNLLKMLSSYNVKVIPGISSAQYFAGLLCMPWHDWKMVSAHGIECHEVREVLSAPKVFFVTGGGNTVASICKNLVKAGLGKVKVSVGENLSYPTERLTRGSAEELANVAFDNLAVMLVERKEPDKLWHWVNTGIPDDEFIRGKVPMTKQEVRAAALSKLRIAEYDILYDLGAGTGSVSIEMALLAKKGCVYAVEHNREAVKLIEENKKRFGVTNLQIIPEDAVDALTDLPSPNAVFIGGSGGKLSEILDKCRKANPELRVCIACVTLETLTEGIQRLSTSEFSDFELTQIAVNRTEVVGSYQMIKAQNPIYLISARGVRL